MANNIDRENVEDILALTPMQQGMLFHYLKHSESSEYFEQLSLRLSLQHCQSHRLCRKTIQEAWNHVVQCNEMLRTIYRWDKLEAPVQIVLKSFEAPVRFYDIKDKDQKVQEKLIADIKKNDINMGIDIRMEPFRITVIELSEEESEMIISNHHILYDGWSSGIIIKEFLEAYKALCMGKEIKKRTKPKFKEYIKWQQKKNKEAQSAYWEKYLEGYEGKSGITGCIQNKEEKGSTGVYETELDNETRKNLAGICRRAEVTEATVINTAWGILLQKYNDREDVVFGTTVSGRHAELLGIEEAVGLYINTLPLRVKGEKEEKTGELIRRIEAETRARANDETVALTEIQAARGIRQGEKLFDTLVVIENYPIDKMLNSEDEIIRIEMSGIKEATNYDITISITLGKRIEIKTTFREDKYETEGIKKLAQHFKNIIKALAEGGNKTVKEIEMLGEEEKKQILEVFNATGADYPKSKTIHRLFEEKAEKTPDKIAVVYEDKQLTYREINEKSNQLARLLREKGVGPDSIVGIMVERCPEMVIGIMGILKASGAYLPIDPEYPADRISYMLNDSQAKILLTHKSWGDKADSKIERIRLDEEACYKGDASNPEHTAASHNLAYIIYTSGSTGKPKGVMIRHQSAINTLTDTEKEYPLEKEDAYLLKTTCTFDVSVMELFGWFIGNGRLVILPSGDEKDARAIIAAIVKNNITHINFVPSMLNVFVEELENGKEKGLGKLRYVFAGGEELGIKLAKRFLKTTEGVRLVNIYGPTETTIYVTRYTVGNESRSEGMSIPIGRLVQNVKAYILDRNNSLQPIGAAGELCIGGDGLSAGYLNKPELTAEKFVANPFIQGEKLYRTGDLARWLPDGNIEYLGRIDRQVKVRGYRIELGEIESRLLSYEAVKAAAVAAREDENGDKYLCAYLTMEKGEILEAGRVREHLAKVLPEYMIPSYYVELNKLPLTSSGKVDKKALPEPEGSINTGKEYEAPRNETEEKLASIWQEILKTDKIGINDSFFELGGHSLKAISMVSKIHKDLNIEISLKDVFQSSTIKQLAKDIEGKAQSGYEKIAAAEEEQNEMSGCYPTSSAQKRIYTLQQFDTGSTAYNLPMVLTVKGKLKKDRLKATFEALVRRHEVLRTSFEIVYRKASGEEIVQRIHEEAEIKIEYREINDVDRLEKRIREFIRPFDLSTAPLMRAGLIKTYSDDYILLIDMHHIISDGVSIEILTREFAALYEGRTLPELKVQYKDYAAWQNKQLKSSSMKKQKEYWIERLSGELPVLNMPTDYARPAVQTFAGEMTRHRLNSQHAEKLRERMKQSGSTLYMYMLSVFNILLSKYGGVEDIIVGSPIAGRTHGDLDNIIGMFVNTLAMRNYPKEEKSFSEFLQEVKENALKAYENQDYQFEELVEQLNIKRDLSRNPLFDVMFAVQSGEEEEITVGDIKLVPEDAQSEISKFDMTLTVEEQGENLILILSYNPMLYRKETMERLLEHFNNILADVAENPEKKLSEIQLMGKEEKKQVLETFNETGSDYPRNKTIHQLFEEKAEKTPDNIAVIYEEQRLSYRELNEKSNQLARILREKGVKGDSIVGIMVERSLEMLIGIIGILKAGGAYLPIDPEYPTDRISYMLNDSNAQILLTHKSWGDKLDAGIEKINLDKEELYEGDADNLKHIATPCNLAYIIYTSGSTGKPKGVMIRHQSAVNILTALEKEYPMEAEAAYLLKTAYTFDVSVTELFGWFVGNGRLVILPGGDEKDAKAIITAIGKNNITHINFVPSMLNIFIEELLSSKAKELGKLKYLFAAGEALRIETVKRFEAAVEGVRLENIYGPTEITIYATSYPVEKDKKHGSIPIGRPMQNVKAYILDKNNGLQPIGIAGELCIGGDGLAAGYLNKPELTAEKFVANPFITGEKMYRTGDLARWLPDGNIEYLGRIDRQVKLRGYRIELGEIESRLMEHEAVKEAAVAAREDENGDKYLCAYITPERKDEILEVSKIREQLMKVLPEYMIPSYYVELNKLPLTGSGKVDKKALPEPGKAAGTGKDYEAPKNETQKKLASIWQEILKTDKIGINDNFFELGGHSLKATSMTGRIYREMKVEIPLKDIFQAPTIRLLSEKIDNTAKGKYEEIEAIVKGENAPSGYYTSSSAQKRIFTLQQFDKESVTYNISMAFAINGRVDIKKLNNAFEMLVKRHEALRTSFELMHNETVSDEIVQYVHEKADIKIEYMQTETEEERSKQIREFIRPFDLGTAPLMRAGLIKTCPENGRQEEAEYLLLLDLHHIISDRVSIEILAKEFAALYEGKELPDLKLQYKDYAAWQNKRLKSDSTRIQKEYWLEKLKGELPVLNMPTDYLRSTVQNFEGDCIRYSMGSLLAGKVRAAANRTGTTIYMYLLAVFNILLSRYSGQDDIIVGSPIAGRNRAGLENIIGMFVNTLAMRNHPNGEKSFSAFLQEVKENALRAYENQDYQFEELVESLNIQRDLSRNPLFDIMFAVQSDEREEITVGGMRLIHYDIENRISKFDMTLTVLEKAEDICYSLEYGTKLFRRDTIERLMRHYINILCEVLSNPDKKLNEIELIGEEEKKQILLKFNDTKANYPKDKTIHQLFEEQAEKTPDKAAVIYGDEKLTYMELNGKANRLARVLRENGTGPDSIVGIMAERSLEMMIGIMGILKAGGAYLPIDPAYPEDRISYMLEDSGAKILLTKTQLSGKAGFKIKTIDLTDKNIYQGDSDNLNQLSNPNNMAYIMYTSGSTGKPKAVVIEHQNVLNTLNALEDEYPMKEEDAYLQKTAYTFDVSVAELFGWFIGKGKLVILPQGDEKDAAAIIEAIIKNGITHINFVPSMLNLFVDVLEKREIKELGKLKYVFAAGEALGVEIVKRFKEATAGIRLENIYGPTEITIYATRYSISLNQGNQSIPIGRPIQNVRAYITNMNNKLQPVGVPGELCIAGAGLARGYFNKPELTEEKFVENPFTAGGRMYKTGDMAKWLPDGNIEYLGRIDQQVKIRGFRIELGEIESRLIKHAAVKEAAVIAKDDENGSKHLYAYIAAAHEFTLAELREHLARELPEYMIPSYFIKLEKMPLNHSGKIDRKALNDSSKFSDQEGNISTGVEYEAPGNELEEKLVSIWQEILKTEGIGINDNFFALGGHSLKATIMAARIHEKINVEVSLKEIFTAPTIKALGEYIRKHGESKYRSIGKALPFYEGETYKSYPASSAQKRMYAMQQMEIESTVYNMLTAFELKGSLNREKMAEVFNTLIERHESLRTAFQVENFHTGEEEIVQKVYDKVSFAIDYLEMKNEDGIEDVIRHFTKPFNLSGAPLMRAGLITAGVKRHILLLDMHHIISDGTSMGILAKEFMALYDGKALPEPKIHYADFASWQNKLLASGKIRNQEEYWLSKLAGELPVLDMPTDYPRPTALSFEGDRFNFTIDKTLTQALDKIALDNGATLFMVLLGAYNVMLHKYTGQEDIIVGSGIAGRSHAELSNIIGMFVNMLAMRSFPDGEKTFKAFLLEVKDTVLEAYENQGYQFEVLVDKLESTRHLNRNPVFDVSFVVQNMDIPEVNTGGLQFGQYKRENKTSKFDLTLYAVEVDGEIQFSMEYSTRLFKKATIERMSEHLINIIKAITRKFDIKLADIEIMNEAEKQQLLDFNNTRTDDCIDRTINTLVEEQTDRTPDNIAVVCNNMHLTYRELDERANQLANYLIKEKGILPDTHVGILIPNTADQVAAILGILKSGGGYVPIDPELPEERIKAIIDDSKIHTIVSVKENIRILNRLQWECNSLHTYICLDTDDVQHEDETIKSALMDKKLWEYVGKTATDEITGGGWSNSYTGENLTQREMDEYGDNILLKLKPYLTKETRVLEIGCASGITMYRIAPLVKLYYGTDLSSSIIEKNREKNDEKHITNVKLKALAAHEIDKIEEKAFDIVIINSVIQCFHGHNYLRKVVEKAIGLMGGRGILFIGDVMDQEKKHILMQSLTEFKQMNRHKGYKTKTDLSEELFVSRGYFEDLSRDIPEIQCIEFTDKIHTIENELTSFRYDALVKINKEEMQEKKINTRHKYQIGKSIIEKYGKERVKSGVAAANTAYVIYTSGTTGKPKGVIIEHRGLVNMCYWHNRFYEVTEKDHATRYAAVGFDASVAELFPYLVKGAALYMVPEEIRLSIAALNRYYEANNITIGFLPTQMYELFMELENRSLRTLLTAGDKLRQYKKRGYRLVNNYGPTENTVVAASFAVEAQYNNIPIGKPIANCRIYILDKYNRLQPVGIPGELCIAGEGLARGYYNRPELTAEKFIENPFQNGERLYKTGDLARWLPDGNIEFLGRIDYQVKIRGNRVELEEIENQLVKCEGVSKAAVIDREDSGHDKYLCAYIVGEKELNIAELQDQLRKVLPEYMIPAFFMQLEKMPVNQNGKLDRRALTYSGEFSGAGDFMNTGARYEAPRDETEEKLVSIWREILKVERIGINDSFFELGGHSLKATAMVARIHKEIKVEVPLKEVFETPTIKELGEYIKQHKESGYEAIGKAVPLDMSEHKESFLVSSAQKRLYTLQQIETDGTGYNMSAAFELEGELDSIKLENVFKELIKRHESLRTSFAIQSFNSKEEIVQRIQSEAVPDIEYHKAEKAEEVKEIAKQFIRPFDLGRAPLLRIGIIEIQPQKHAMLLDMHHIISDGTSMGLLVKEFGMLYKGEILPGLRLQYKDYACWQRERKKSGAMKKQEEYWLSEFESAGKVNSEIPVLDMPTDFQRPSRQSFSGDRIEIEIDEILTGKLNVLAGKTGTTLYMLLLAGMNILLSKYSRQEDIVIGSPIAGRPHADLERIVGVFINTLAMRNYPEGFKTFAQFLQEVKVKALKAYENQEYQFEELVENIHVRRDISRNPIFDVMLIMQNMEMDSIEMEGLIIKPYDMENVTSKFDLTVNVWEKGEKLGLGIEYCTKLFRKATIQSLGKHLINILEKAAEKPDIKLEEIEITGNEEKKQLLEVFNSTKVEYASEKTIHRLFEEQADVTPEKTALVYKDKTLTYKELNEKANQLARVLRKRGVCDEQIVGIMAERSLEMLIGIIGILKAGGAYLPIDPEYPEERIQYMLEDSGVSVLLTQARLKDNLRFEGEVIFLEDVNIYRGDNKNLENKYSSHNLAYVIYTSGSTGKPKGVMIEHRSVVNFIKGMMTAIDFSESDSILCLTSVSFDIMGLETLLPLSMGMKIVIADEEAQRDVIKLSEILEKEKIDTLQLTPSRMKLMLENEDCRRSIRRLGIIMIGGEAMPKALLKEVQSIAKARIYNMYGPTETTIWSTIKEVTKEDRVTIGKPIANTRIYILGKNNQIQPINVPGELCIAGDGLARGYLNNPLLTKEKFIPDPFTIGERMYKTGDLARWLPDGDIEFSGRMDQQVKIRGYRIELGEIESLLICHESVKEAVVTAKEDSGGNKYLCAYITAERELTLKELRAYLTEKLPEYMIPSYFVQLEEIPLTQNGKIDRKALPEPFDSINSGEEYEAPRDKIEEKLAAVWQEVLKLEKVGIRDNFFALGGDSVKAIQVSARLQQQGYKLQVRDLLENPVIGELSKYVTEDCKKAELMSSEIDTDIFTADELEEIYDLFEGKVK